jgi:hypothetical protein
MRVMEIDMRVREIEAWYGMGTEIEQSVYGGHAAGFRTRQDGSSRWATRTLTLARESANALVKRVESNIASTRLTKAASLRLV